MKSPQNTYIDTQSGLHRLMGNQKLYARMLGLFLQSAELDELDSALAQSDIAKAADAAHAIKGLAGNLSLSALFQSCSALMNSLRAGVLDANLLAAYHEDLAQTKAQVRALLTRWETEAN